MFNLMLPNDGMSYTVMPYPMVIDLLSYPEILSAYDSTSLDVVQNHPFVLKLNETLSDNSRDKFQALNCLFDTCVTNTTGLDKKQLNFAKHLWVDMILETVKEQICLNFNMVLPDLYLQWFRIEYKILNDMDFYGEREAFEEYNNVDDFIISILPKSNWRDRAYMSADNCSILSYELYAALAPLPLCNAVRIDLQYNSGEASFYPKTHLNTKYDFCNQGYKDAICEYLKCKSVNALAEYKRAGIINCSEQLFPNNIPTIPSLKSISPGEKIIKNNLYYVYNSFMSMIYGIPRPENIDISFWSTRDGSRYYPSPINDIYCSDWLVSPMSIYDITCLDAFDNILKVDPINTFGKEISEKLLKELNK